MRTPISCVRSVTRVRDDAVQADRRQRQRDDGEDHQHDHRHALPRDRRFQHLVHRAHLEQRQVLVDVSRTAASSAGTIAIGSPAVAPRRSANVDDSCVSGRYTCIGVSSASAIELHVGDDADDFAPRVRRLPAIPASAACRPRPRPATGALASVSLITIVTLRTSACRVAEQPAAHETHPHRLEVAGADRRERRARQLRRAEAPACRRR